MADVALNSEQARDIDFWRALQPDLSIDSGRSAPQFNVGDTRALMRTLRHEGYVNVPGVVPDEHVLPIRRCIQTLHERNIPLAFAFVYDELWHAFQGVSSFMEAALGRDYQALPDFWVWFVPPSEAVAGWGPHRDRITPTVDRDNSPHTLTVWLPFSDATPLNGCIYVLPAHLDPRFKRRVWDGETNNVVEEPQNIRALPATAGSLLAWNQGVLHWGGRGSRLAPDARVSAAFEFQRRDKPPFNTPLLNPHKIPPFSQRLGLVGKQVLQYQHMYPLTSSMAALAQELRDRLMPGAALAM